MPAIAQDDIRETLQKERFNFKNAHSRDAKYDVRYKMPIDFKTRNINRGCVSTKRKFKLQTLKEWENTIILVSDYEDSSSLLETDYIIFPDALIEWRAEQLRKMTCSNRASYYSLDDIKYLRDSIESIDENIEEIFRKLEIQLHLNDPSIGKTLFDSEGAEIYANSKRIKTKHPEWFIKIPDGVDKATYLRDKIDEYINYKNDVDSSLAV